ncbi:MAG: tetratricopeptide (TPR) repeat protein [Bradymonadia bacterium]|jgi:tetratricopeptide (TPR) repeat protein
MGSEFGGLAAALRVELLFGQAFLVAENVELGPWARLQSFRAEVPGRRSPRDVGHDPLAYRGVRLQTSDFHLEIDAGRLRRSLSGLARNLDGIAEIDLIFLEDHIRLSVRLEPVGGDESLVIARFGALLDLHGTGAVTLRAFEYLVLGTPRKPAPLIIAEAMDAILASSEVAPLLATLAPERVRDTLVINVAALAIAEAFGSAGWKLPGTERLRCSRVSLAPGRATLVASAIQSASGLGQDSANSDASRAALSGLEAASRAEAGEDALFRGDLGPAAAAYRESLARHGAHPFVLLRLLHVLIAEGSPASEAEAAALIADAERRGDLPIGMLAVQLGLATSLERKGELTDILAARLRRSSLVEDEVDTLLSIARSLRAERSDDAVAWVDRALRVAPRSASALQLRVRLARARGETEVYEDGLTRLLALGTSRTVRARLHRELARVRRESGDFAGARVHLLQGLELTPEAPELHVELGRASAGAGRSVEAVQSLRRAASSELADSELSATALTEAAFVWADGLGDVNSALYDVRRALTLLPDRAETHRAHLKIAEGSDEDEILRAVETAVSRLDPTVAEHLPVLAAAYERGIELDESRGARASADRRRARMIELGVTAPTIRTHPTPPPAPVAPVESSELTPVPIGPTRTLDEDTVNRGVADARQRGDSTALAEFLPQAAELADSDSAKASLLGELGQLLYYDLEDAARAAQYLEEARRLDPEGAGSEYGLLSALEAVYEDTASAEGLLSVYRRKLEQAGSDEIRNVYRLLMAGVLFEQLGRPSEALSQLHRVLESDVRNVPALRLRAKVWETTGRRADAANELEGMLKMPEVDPFERQEILRDLGRAEWHSLARLDRAARRFEELLSEIPGDTDCISSLKQIYARGERWESFVDVLRREMCILAGSATAFPTVTDAARANADNIPEALRITFAQILTEAAEIQHRQLGEPILARALVDRAVALAPSDIFANEALLELARVQRDDHALQTAVLVLSTELLDEGARDELLREGHRASIRTAGEAEFVEKCQKLGIARSEPTDAPAAPKRKSDSRLDRLDLLASEGRHQDAIAAIDAWLPSARQPGVRRSLLLRKGRWLLDRGAEARSAVLPLKGALILDASAADTRLELLRASCRLGDVSQAKDQLREYLEARTEPPAISDREARSLQRALDDLTALPRGPGQSWVSELVRTSSPPVFTALQALSA